MNIKVTKPPLTPRDFAIFRHVWQLSKEEQQKLDRYFLLRTTAEKLVELVDRYYEEHLTTFRDTLQHDTFHVELEYLRTSLMQLEEHGIRNPTEDKLLLVSVRVNYNSALAIGLVKEVAIPGFNKEQYEALPELGA